MIVRILEDGQYKVDKSTAKKLDELDTKLAKALDKGDDAAFAKHLAEPGEDRARLGPDALAPASSPPRTWRSPPPARHSPRCGSCSRPRPSR